MISASNLVSFKYNGHVARILLGNVPTLVEASYAGLYAFFLLRHCDQMPSDLSQLETLSLVLTWQVGVRKHIMFVNGVPFFHLCNESC